jgi:GDPmannose 4,6-dehydratase
MTKKALITGISGQDGAYLAKLLVTQGYRVVGALRRTSSRLFPRLEELGIANEIEFADFDLAEFSNILRTLEKVKPDEIYNFASQSFVAVSFEQPIYTSDVTGLGALRILEAMRTAVPNARFYQASSSEMFGKAQVTPQDEMTPFYPRSPYGFAKLFSHWATVNYRESYNLHATSGILFNHESPLRGREFVTRKITWALARMRQGDLDVLELGNLDAKRDWGFAGDYVQGIWAMVQQDNAQDFVLATGETRSVRDFVETAARKVGFDLEWSGRGVNERAIDRKSGKTLVRVNPDFHRPADVDALVGRAEKAERILGWTPKVGFDELVSLMVDADCRRYADPHNRNLTI